MKRMRKSIKVILCLLLGVSLAQNSNYLTQKLMVENDLRNRIVDAMSKIIDDTKYVVDVRVELEISESLEEQITYESNKPKIKGTKIERPVSETIVQKELSPKKSGSSIGGLPIPGFEFEIESGRDNDPDISKKETIEELIPSDSRASEEPSEYVVSRMTSHKRPSYARIIKQEISIILQKDAAPELIENIRQIIMVASKFNRARGDELSIMTASFKERRDEKTAEQILLKTIADKLETLENQRVQKDLAQEDNWKDELDQYKKDEELRREEDRQFFKTELTKLELSAKERSFQEEKEEILKRDSIKLNQLNAEILALRKQLENATSDSQSVAAQSAMSQKELERKNLDTQIDEKLKKLNAVQEDLDRLENDMDSTPTMTVVIMSILGALVLILLIAIILMLVNRSKPQYAAPPPQWAYPPRPRVRKKKRPVKKPEPETPVTEAAPAPASVANVPPPSQFQSDPGVLQSEISDMKQAVVSMSVGQPATATRIVKEWMEEEAPPAPEPETPADSEETDEGGNGSKKKKKK